MRGAQYPVCIMHAQGDPKTMQDNPPTTMLFWMYMIFWNSRSRGLNNWALNVGKLLRTRGLGLAKHCHTI